MPAGLRFGRSGGVARGARDARRAARGGLGFRRRSDQGGGRQQGPGAGETTLDFDRRKLRDRIPELKGRLEAVRRDADNRRSARRGRLRAALVGHADAGKPSPMRAQTGSQGLVEDKPFATLGAAVRTPQPEARPRVFLSDTAGFIKQPPRGLVASFRSALAEAPEASLPLFAVDAPQGRALGRRAPRRAEPTGRGAWAGDGRCLGPTAGA